MPQFKPTLRAWRKKHRLALKEAASELGVPLQTYKEWEYGKSEPKYKPCRECVEERMKEYEITHTARK